MVVQVAASAAGEASGALRVDFTAHQSGLGRLPWAPPVSWGKGRKADGSFPAGRKSSWLNKSLEL